MHMQYRIYSTWLNPMFTLGLKIDAVTIQTWPLLITHKQCSHPDL